MKLARRRVDAPHPPERTPPFLLAERDGAVLLIAPFTRRPRGPTAAEVATVEVVAAHLAGGLPAPPCWIGCDGSVTAATIGEGQITRRLIECAWFPVKVG